MIEIERITNIEGKRRIAILDTSSISFIQGLSEKGVQTDSILKDYSDLTGGEEGNLYKIVLASTRQLARVRGYLRRYVESDDILDMDAYKNWIKKLYDEWPLSDNQLSNGRVRKKNAGEISITILAEIVSWYYPETKALTVYSQDYDVFEFQKRAEADLREVFASRVPVPISYKSNDAILCQLVREELLCIDKIDEYRKYVRKITYSREQDDHSTVLVTELVDNELFAQIVTDRRTHIIF